jgi:hypothetical protein
MKQFRIACTTRAGSYIETEITASDMTGAIESFIYELGIAHQTFMADVVELDLTELPQPL